jgi:hypothetical protein
MLSEMLDARSAQSNCAFREHEVVSLAASEMLESSQLCFSATRAVRRSGVNPAIETSGLVGLNLAHRASGLSVGSAREREASSSEPPEVVLHSSSLPWSLGWDCSS